MSKAGDLRLKKQTDNRRQKHYSTERNLYLILLLVSSLFICASCFIDVKSRLFTIIAGLGCSGIASVIVAWLLDIAACKRKEEANEELLNHLFDKFDATVQYELNCILEVCAKLNSTINIEKQYCIQEIEELLEKAEGDNPVWGKSFHNFGVAFASVDSSVLLSSGSTPQHNELYSIVKSAQENYRAYEIISGKYKPVSRSTDSMEYVFLCNDVSNIERIYSLRNKKIVCAVSEESKDYIRALRNHIVK